jgi:hypothetical protein
MPDPLYRGQVVEGATLLAQRGQKIFGLFRDTPTPYRTLLDTEGERLVAGVSVCKMGVVGSLVWGVLPPPLCNAHDA